MGRDWRMIVYNAFWETLKQSEESTYTLINRHHISSSTIDKLRKNKPLTTTTLNDLCRILQCDISDIACYIPGENEQILWFIAGYIEGESWWRRFQLWRTVMKSLLKQLMFIVLVVLSRYEKRSGCGYGRKSPWLWSRKGKIPFFAIYFNKLRRT